jgi:type II secretory pathway component PulJ
MNPQHQPVRRSARRSAFTLLEMIISIGLFVTLMGFLFTFYDTVLREREEGQAVSRNAQLARVVLDRMARELRQATANTPSYGTGWPALWTTNSDRRSRSIPTCCPTKR